MFCGNCGKELKNGEKFCTGCGTRVILNPYAGTGGTGQTRPNVQNHDFAAANLSWDTREITGESLTGTGNKKICRSCNAYFYPVVQKCAICGKALE
jgi:hypothetical protein